MKTTNEIMSDVLDAELYEQDDLRACTLYSVKALDIQKIAKAYAVELIDHILTRPDMIYVEEAEGQSFTYGDAVYSYEAFDKLKKELL